MSRSVLPALLLLLCCACTEAPPCLVEPGREDDRRGNSTCLVEEGGRVLLVRQRFSGRVALPGGRREPGETGQCTAHRETLEETGFEVVVGGLLGETSGTLIFGCRLRDGSADSPVPGASGLSRLEVSGASWVPADSFGRLDWRFDDHEDEILEILQGGRLPVRESRGD
jgi:8-oxo-dGTP diphosphatase